MNANVIKNGDCDVFVGSSALREFESFIVGNYKETKKFVLVDENTLQHCWPRVDAAVSGLENIEIIEIPSGEENKTLEICAELWRTLTAFKADRSSLLINVGGGVITDMGGFVASTFKRGMKFVNVPTTLLSQVDASVGGKTGVDFDNLKNHIGVFNKPEAVFVYPGFITTQDKENILSGFAEMIKHALIFDNAAWQEIKTADLGKVDWSILVHKSVAIKNDIVCQDPKEHGIRKMLNFGHTIGHAIESDMLAAGTPILHGYGVIMGMIAELYLSVQLMDLPEARLNEVVTFVKSHYELPKVDKSSYERLLLAMENDKKNENGEMRFSLLEEIGKGQININVPFHQIIESIEFYNAI